MLGRVTVIALVVLYCSVVAQGAYDSGAPVTALSGNSHRLRILTVQVQFERELSPAGGGDGARSAVPGAYAAELPSAPGTGGRAASVGPAPELLCLGSEK